HAGVGAGAEQLLSTALHDGVRGRSDTRAQADPRDPDAAQGCDVRSAGCGQDVQRGIDLVSECGDDVEVEDTGHEDPVGAGVVVRLGALEGVRQAVARVADRPEKRVDPGVDEQAGAGFVRDVAGRGDALGLVVDRPQSCRVVGVDVLDVDADGAGLEYAFDRLGDVIGAGAETALDVST